MIKITQVSIQIEVRTPFNPAFVVKIPIDATLLASCEVNPIPVETILLGLNVLLRVEVKPRTVSTILAVPVCVSLIAKSPIVAIISTAPVIKVSAIGVIPIRVVKFRIREMLLEIEEVKLRLVESIFPKRGWNVEIRPSEVLRLLRISIILSLTGLKLIVLISPRERLLSLARVANKPSVVRSSRFMLKSRVRPDFNPKEVVSSWKNTLRVSAIGVIPILAESSRAIPISLVIVESKPIVTERTLPGSLLKIEIRPVRLVNSREISISLIRVAANPRIVARIFAIPEVSSIRNPTEDCSFLEIPRSLETLELKPIVVMIRI